MHKKQILNDFKASDKSINSIIEISKLLLISKGIKNAKSEVEWYLQKLHDYNSVELYNIKNKKISNTNFNQILNFLVKRLNDVPFQHIMGCAPFYGRDFIVNSNALIPRQESEILINILKNKNQCKMLDIGTGSGCLAITSILEGISRQVDAIDINRDWYVYIFVASAIIISIVIIKLLIESILISLGLFFIWRLATS